MIRRGTPADIPSPAANGAARSVSARWYLLVFLVALFARAGWGAVALGRADDPAALEFPDERQYWLMASGVAAGNGLQDEFGFRAMRMPLYPSALSLVAGMTHGVVIAKIAQWVIGSLAAVFAFGLAASLFNLRVGVLAGLLVAVDPFQVFFSSLLLTETLSTAALIALWWIAAPLLVQPRPWNCGVDRSDPSRAGKEAGGDGTHTSTPEGLPVSSRSEASLGRWCALGTTAALCVHARESSLGLIVALFVLLVVLRSFDRRALLGAGIAASIVLLALIPWAARNQRVTGHWCWLTHRVGVSLYDGVGPQADGSSDLAEIQSVFSERGPSARGEVEWNRYFLRESQRAILSDPARIARLALTKLRRMWSLVPNVSSHQSAFTKTVSLLWTVPTFALTIVGAVLLPRIVEKGGPILVLFLLLPAIYFSALHALFVGSVRYRLPAIPMLEILAAGAIMALYGRLQHRNPVWGPGT